METNAEKLREQMVETIVDLIAKIYHGPICQISLRRIATEAFSRIDPVEASQSMEISTKLAQEIKDKLTAIQDCGEAFCPVCSVARVVSGMRPPPSVLGGYWGKTTVWLSDLLKSAAESAQLGEEDRINARESVFVLSWLAAQSRLAEDQLAELARLSEENTKLREALSMLGRGEGGLN